MKNYLNLAVSVALACFTGASQADVWDTASESDGNQNTDNELIHGSLQIHDLGVRPGPEADEDWYKLTVPPYSSMEVVMDGTTGDLNVSFDQTQLELLDSVSFAVVGSHLCIGSSCFSKRLSRINMTNLPVPFFVRVSGQGCTTSCTAADQYTIRARETTVAVARFNNTGAQVTVLLTQNASDSPITARAHFWNAAGTLLAVFPIDNLAPKALSVLSTPSVGGVSGQSGSITVAHDGQFGGLNVKSVALEPTTGFSFDSPGVTRPY